MEESIENLWVGDGEKFMGEYMICKERMTGVIEAIYWWAGLSPKGPIKVIPLDDELTITKALQDVSEDHIEQEMEELHDTHELL